MKDLFLIAPGGLAISPHQYLMVIQILTNINRGGFVFFIYHEIF